MAPKKRENIRDEDLTGLKFFDKLLPLFEPLHEIGCQRDKAGNRQLHYDEYCSLLLLRDDLPVLHRPCRCSPTFRNYNSTRRNLRSAIGDAWPLTLR